MRRGFTLIELLGVIVILSILSLIAIPTISKNIEDLRINSVTSSVYGLMNAANNYYVKNDLSGDIIFKCDGNSCKNNRGGKLKIDGEIPISGEIIKHIDSVEVVDIKLRGYCAVGNRTKLNVSTECIDVLKPTLSLAIGKRETNSLTFGISAMSPDKIKKITYEFDGQKVVEKTNSNNINTTKVYTSLKENKSYTLKVSIEDETGKMVEKEIKTTTDSVGYIKFYITRYTNTYKGNKQYVSAAIKPTYIGNLELNGYYVMSMRDAYSNVDGTLKGTNTKTKKLKANNWYYFDTTPTITYRKYSESTSDYIYAYAIDSKKQTKTASAVIPKIDPIPGFYDSEYKLLLSWENAVNKYNFKPEIDYEIGNAFKKNDLGNNAYLLKKDIKSLNNTSAIVIPNDIEKIGAYAFARFQGLKDILFGKNIKIIGNNAFENCIHNTDMNLKLPDKLETLGDEAFYSNTLKSIIIPASLKEFRSSIEYVAQNRGYDFQPFAGLNAKFVVDKKNSFIEDVNNLAIINKNTKELLVSRGYIPEGTTIIGKSAFAYNNTLNNIKIPSTIKKIGERAFYSTGLTSIDIPDSVTEIGSSAFAMIYPLSSIKFSKNIKNIPDNVLELNVTLANQCKSTDLTSVVIPEGVTKIGYSAFAYRCNLSIVTFPNTLTRIEAYAFENTKLSNISIPSKLEYIGSKAFGGTNIKTLNLPDSIKTFPTQMMWGSSIFEQATYKGKKYVCSGNNCMNLVESK